MMLRPGVFFGTSEIGITLETTFTLQLLANTELSFRIQWSSNTLSALRGNVKPGQSEDNTLSFTLVMSPSPVTGPTCFQILKHSLQVFMPVCFYPYT